MGAKREIGRVRRKWEQKVAPVLATTRMLDEHHNKGEQRAKAIYGLPESAQTAQVSIDGWRQGGKATYLVDDDLAAELAATELPEGCTPYRVLTHRPHNSPLFVMNTPLKGQIPKDSEVLDINYHGFIVYPCKVNGLTKEMSCLSILVVWFGEASTGGTVSATVEIPTSPLTLAQDAESVSDENGVYLQRLHHEALNTEVGLEMRVQDWGKISELLMLAINLVLYTSAVNADLAPLPEPTVGSRSVAPKHAPNIHTLGFRVGAALRAARSTTSTASAPTGRSVTPHLRRAHWHRFWTGPRDGERKVIVRWVSQTFVNTSEGDYTPAIRPVSKQTD